MSEVDKFFPIKVQSVLGQGSFGQVVAVVANDGHSYAVKREKLDCKVPQLEYEYNMYVTHMRDLSCVPKVVLYWTSANDRSMMFERLGKNLEQLKEFIHGDNVLWIATRLVQCVAMIHEKGILHRDIKLENILIGASDNPTKIGSESNFFIVDFGLSKCYKFADGKHIPWITDKHLRGTPRYASVNTHKGFQQGRRDDLESLGYCLIYLHCGNLPWMGIKKANTKELASAVGEMKCNMPVETLCANCPPQLLCYMQYVRNLQFDEKPDYNYLQQCLRPQSRGGP